MVIKKTVGVARSGSYNRKGYDIHTDTGGVFKATPLGSQRYQCNGLSFKSLSAVKDSILKGALGEKDGDAEEALEKSTLEGPDTWDCAHPCALLINSMDRGPKGHSASSQRLCGMTRNTLDSYGWLNEEGKPDTERAEREFNRVRRIENLKTLPNQSDET